MVESSEPVNIHFPSCKAATLPTKVMHTCTPRMSNVAANQAIGAAGAQATIAQDGLLKADCGDVVGVAIVACCNSCSIEGEK